MSAQVGIPKYKDIVNKKFLDELKNNINLLCVIYGKLASKNGIENRESDNYEQYKTQYEKDIVQLEEISAFAQKLLNKSNEAIFEISKRAIENHIFPDE